MLQAVPLLLKKINTPQNNGVHCLKFYHLFAVFTAKTYHGTEGNHKTIDKSHPCPKCRLHHDSVPHGDAVLFFPACTSGRFKVT